MNLPINPWLDIFLFLSLFAFFSEGSVHSLSVSSVFRFLSLFFNLLNSAKNFLFSSVLGMRPKILIFFFKNKVYSFTVFSSALDLGGRPTGFFDDWGLIGS